LFYNVSSLRLGCEQKYPSRMTIIINQKKSCYRKERISLLMRFKLFWALRSWMRSLKLRHVVLEMTLTSGRLSTNDNRGGRRRSKLGKKNGGNTSSIRCYHSKKERHTKRFCPKRQNKATNLDRSFGSSKRSDGLFVSSEAALMKDSFESSTILLLSSSVDVVSG